MKFRKVLEFKTIARILAENNDNLSDYVFTDLTLRHLSIFQYDNDGLGGLTLLVGKVHWTSNQVTSKFRHPI